MTWTPFGLKSTRSELAIQTLFRSRLRIIAPAVRVVAIPNGGKRGFKAQAQAKREGIASGFPDVQCLWSHGSGPENAIPRVAYIEFKKGDATACSISENQREWLDWFTASGFPCGVFRCPDAAIEWLRGIGVPFVDKLGL